MKEYTNKISLVQNNRGVWDLDPFKGCEDGINNNSKGCYGLCYAYKIAKFRGYNFGKTVYRYFETDRSLGNILKKISQSSFIKGVQPPLVRIGVMCDPSFDWEHTLNIIEKIKLYNSKIVVITKHWKELKENQLYRLKGLYINTSISALDTEIQIKHRLGWYNKLKKHCHSILRVNTADFNDKNLKKIQNKLLNNKNVINNLLRIPKNHKLIKNKIINVEKRQFLTSNVLTSKYNKDVHFGYCVNCPDKCGINFFTPQPNKI